MTELRCSWCDQRFGNWTALADHEDQHVRDERPDYEAEGAAARAAGKRFDDCPHPARTWPWREWTDGWLAADQRRKAA